MVMKIDDNSFEKWNLAYGAAINAGFQIVVQYYGIPMGKVIRPGRSTADIVQVRQVAHYLIKKIFSPKGIPMAAIGRIIGNKDHATVYHSYRCIDNLITPNSVNGKIQDPQLVKDLQILEPIIKTESEKSKLFLLKYNTIN
jgi:hypothetical protein